MGVKVYIPLIAFGGLLGATYYLLGIKALTSNIFMLAIYSMFVPILFFTYGAYIEKQIIKKQVVRLIENLEESAKDLDFTIPNVDIAVDKTLDESVKKNNRELIKIAFGYLTAGFLGGIILTILLWHFASKQFNYKHMVYDNISLLVLVAITEIVFFGVVSRNYRTLDSNKIKKFILEELSKKLK